MPTTMVRNLYGRGDGHLVRSGRFPSLSALADVTCFAVVVASDGFSVADTPRARTNERSLGLSLAPRTSLDYYLTRPHRFS